MQAKSYWWYNWGKHRDIEEDNLAIEVNNAENQDTLYDNTDNPISWREDNIIYDWDDFNWPDPDDNKEDYDIDYLPEEDLARDKAILLPQAGPGPQTEANQASKSRSVQPCTLDNDNDEHYVVEHPTAGQVLS